MIPQITNVLHTVQTIEHYSYIIITNRYLPNFNHLPPPSLFDLLIRTRSPRRTKNQTKIDDKSKNK